MVKPCGRLFVVPAPRTEPHYVVPRETIDRDWLALLRELDRLLAALPSTLKPLLAVEPIPSKRQSIVRREIARVRREFVATTKAMQEKIASTEH